jgi:molybdopterin converting factor small subunit
MPPEQDADAIARGDIIPESAPKTDGASPPPASAAPADEKETPNSETPDSKQGSEATPEPVETAKAEPADDDETDKRIPQSRFKEAVNKERERAAAAEAELKKYREREAQREQAANFEESEKKVKEMLKQHSSLLADGDLDKAADVMEQVLQLRDDMNQARMDQKAASARDSATIAIRYDTTVERLEREYPEINPEAEEFNEDLVRQVQLTVAGIMNSEGKDPATALQEATDMVLKPLKAAKKESLREQPSQEAVEAGLRRKQAQIDKNVAAAASQPPETKDVGKDHDATGGSLDARAVANMSWEEFINVPDEELAKMRGDYIN